MNFAVYRLMVETQRLWWTYCATPVSESRYTEYRRHANALELLTGRWVCQGEIR